MKLTVAIIDDDPRYRSSLAHAVMSAPDMALVGAADDLDSGRTLLEISKGNTHEEIAQMMGVSRQTVLTYVTRTYRKLQVHGKVAAIVKAQRTGLIAR